MVSIFRACKRTGKKFIIDLYTAVILEATGNPKIPRSFWDDIALFIPFPQRIQIVNNQWFESLNLHSANRIYADKHADLFKQSVLLFRPIHQKDLEKENLLEDATYIYSQYKGYWDQDDFKPLRDWLQKHRISKESVHTSGHATKEELIRFAQALKAKKIIPIHTFNPVKFSEIFENAELKTDGECWKI